MGDAADDLYFQEIERELKREIANQEAIKESRMLERSAEKIILDYAFGDLTWKTRNGDVLYVDEMTVAHIQNCLEIVREKASAIALAWERVFNQELRKRSKL